MVVKIRSDTAGRLHEVEILPPGDVLPRIGRISQPEAPRLLTRADDAQRPAFPAQKLYAVVVVAADLVDRPRWVVDGHDLKAVRNIHAVPQSKPVFFPIASGEDQEDRIPRVVVKVAIPVAPMEVMQADSDRQPA